MINEVSGEDFFFEDVDFIKEENECFVFEAGVVLDLSKHLHRLHQFVSPITDLVVSRNISIKLVYCCQEDDAGYLVLTRKKTKLMFTLSMSFTHPDHVNPVLSLLSVSANISDLELNAAHKKLVGNWNRELRQTRTGALRRNQPGMPLVPLLTLIMSSVIGR